MDEQQYKAVRHSLVRDAMGRADSGAVHAALVSEYGNLSVNVLNNHASSIKNFETGPDRSGAQDIVAALEGDDPMPAEDRFVSWRMLAAAKSA